MKYLNIVMVISLVLMPGSQYCDKLTQEQELMSRPKKRLDELTQKERYERACRIGRQLERQEQELKTQGEASGALTTLDKTLVGGAVGAAEVGFPGQLLSYCMNCKIKGEKFVARLAYNGCFANALGQMPITAVQMGVQSGLSKVVRNHQQKDHA